MHIICNAATLSVAVFFSKRAGSTDFVMKSSMWQGE